MEKTLELVINDIIKDDKFIFDKQTGFYYLNNRVDNTFLFEFNPSSMILYSSNIVFEYIKANRLLSTGYLKKDIIKTMYNLYDFKFKDLCFNDKSVLGEVKFNKLYNVLQPNKHKYTIFIPKNMLNFSEIEFELTIPINCDINIRKNLKTRKIITSNYEIIDISDLMPGYYNIFISVPNLFNKRRIQIIIENYVYEK